MNKFENSKKIYNKAIKKIPGGVNSPVRNFGSVDMKYPVFIKKAYKSILIDEDNNKYIDLIGSWGPMILGHNNKKIIKSVKKALKKGTSYGLPTKQEVQLAKLIVENIPFIDKIRFTTSGTEATMSAIRLARAYTKRDKIIKFKGCYHGHSDSLLVSGGSYLLTGEIIDSNGITKKTIEDTLLADYNNKESVIELFEKYKDEIAAVIVEPIPANMGIILPKDNFLQFLRDITKEYNSILIFDEVISGFRIGFTGASGYYNVTPDLVTYGKIIGGGFPVGAFGGKKEIMDMIAPVGNVYHAGTLSGNPIAVAAGIATLTKLLDNQIYIDLEEKQNYITTKLNKLIKKYNLKVCINSIGSLFTIYFGVKKVENYEDSLKADKDMFNKYFKYMLENGVMLPPSKYEAIFLSTCHSKKNLDYIIKLTEEFFISMN
ncbi:MAG: glutamate-semialdehyde -aminomutase [Fusobacteriaceae bacterium]|jgi:glutamate-1-semialdehyde 2,1-aminomutase|nr:Glutamate-semialdehyde -aminomutase [Fusobacteriales bacterium]MDN5303376.1 glutamate-semialdehyde -aminomutase [Fusobacteriaceae bacterium]